MHNNNAIELLEELLHTIDQYSKLDVVDSDIRNIQAKIKSAFTLRCLSSKFDVPVENISEYGYEWHSVFAPIGNHSIGYYDGENRTISWPDNDIQPKNEWLYQVCFSTGAYVFGEGYPTDTFKGFFNELKLYKPKYIDSANKALYFDGKSAGEIHRNILDIFNKHKANVQKELDQIEIDKLKAKLAKLEAGV